MISTVPKRLIQLGFFLVLLGFLLPFLMVLQIVETTFFFSFISWGATTTGLILGSIGGTQYVNINRN